MEMLLDLPWVYGIFLKNKGQEATIISPNDFPKIFKMMPGGCRYFKIFELENTQSKKAIEEATLVFTYRL